MTACVLESAARALRAARASARMHAALSILHRRYCTMSKAASTARPDPALRRRRNKRECVRSRERQSRKKRHLLPPKKGRRYRQSKRILRWNRRLVTVIRPEDAADYQLDPNHPFVIHGGRPPFDEFKTVEDIEEEVRIADEREFDPLNAVDGDQEPVYTRGRYAKIVSIQRLESGGLKVSRHADLFGTSLTAMQLD